MNVGRTVFSQVMDLFPLTEFRGPVAQYGGEHKLQSFSCLDHFLCMAFAQLTYRESLRDIEVCLRSIQSRLYHVGFRGHVWRNTLANANEQRDCKSMQVWVTCSSRRLGDSAQATASRWRKSKPLLRWIRPPSTSVFRCFAGLHLS